MTHHHHHHRHKHKGRSGSKHLRKMIPAPKVHDVHEFLRSAIRRFEKRGRRYYKKRPQRLNATISRMLEEHKVKGTLTEYFWMLKAKCIMLGKEPAYL